MLFEAFDTATGPLNELLVGVEQGGRLAHYRNLQCGQLYFDCCSLQTSQASAILKVASSSPRGNCLSRICRAKKMLSCYITATRKTWKFKLVPEAEPLSVPPDKAKASGRSPLSRTLQRTRRTLGKSSTFNDAPMSTIPLSRYLTLRWRQLLLAQRWVCDACQDNTRMMRTSEPRRAAQRQFGTTRPRSQNEAYAPNMELMRNRYNKRNQTVLYEHLEESMLDVV